MLNIYKEQFPHMVPLDTSFYIEAPYKGNPYRRSKALVIMSALRNYDAFRALTDATQTSMVKQIETGCVVAAKQSANEENIQCGWENMLFKIRYQDYVYEVARNLDYTNNTYLCELVVGGKIAPKDVAFVKDMNPEATKKYADRTETRKNAKVDIKVSSLYQCDKCGRSECFVTSVQLRSSDEGKDDNVVCVFCGHKWIVRN